ncbi:YDG domain-containing protein [Sphingosinicella microcystinivorans]|uniref:YDG domain-containing protein n=1 Tax=Sphingosinicella microcystinivorans TaxID=335406 RepID=UPI0022F39A4E|nr:YDG domain-containing protein [Sphingosinicella microcystinivorans]WBX84472.1 YDG domain-containing protein [Sphingosinicella microcystinivorans]
MVLRPALDKRRIILAGTSLAALALAGAAHAGPSGGTVSAGSASIAGDGTGRVTVTQTSDRAILDWNSFSIGAGESARFIQPGSTSVAVNRVTGADPSSILGSLTANGRVVLINRNGIAFGKDATVDVGGLVATTADIDRQAFMATGSLNFSGGSLPGASVVNEGRITVRDAGLAALVAPSVRNSGTIVADLDVSGWSYQGIMGAGYFGTRNADVGLDALDVFGNAVALNAAGDRMAVGVAYDDGTSGVSTDNYGAVYLFSFTDGNFSGGALQGIIGKGYADGKSIDVDMLDAGDALGVSVSLNAVGDLLAVGAAFDDGSGNSGSNFGAVHLFGFTDGNFSGGTHLGTIGQGYGADAGKPANIDMADHVDWGIGSGLDANDNFGSSVSLNAAGNRLAVGAVYDDGFGNPGAIASNSGAVYLFTFDHDSQFVGGSLSATIGYDYSGANDLALPTVAGQNDAFGRSVALNAKGDRLAAGAFADDGFGADGVLNIGAVHLFTFDDADMDTGFTGGAHVGTIGKNYAGAGDIDIAPLANADNFGYALSLNAAGDRLAVGSPGDDGYGIDDTGLTAPTASSGAIYLFSFTDGDFSGGTHLGTVGSGYMGAKDINVALDQQDGFGTSVALNAASNRMASGAYLDDGTGSDPTGNYGAVHLFSFEDTSFSGGRQVGIIGHGYAGMARDVHVGLDTGDQFGIGVALNAAGNRLAVGASGDDGFGDPGTTDNAGAVYLFSFTDGDFNGAALEAIIGSGYTGGKNIPVALDTNDGFGSGIAFNAAGDRLAIGAHRDDGFDNIGPDGPIDPADIPSLTLGNMGAVRLFAFDDEHGAFSNGAHVGTIGYGYTGAGDLDLGAGVADPGNRLDIGSTFGVFLSLNADGTRLAAGSHGDRGYDNDQVGTGAVYLFTFDDGDFTSPTHVGTIGKGYVGDGDIDMSSMIGMHDLFGRSVALNAAGDRLVATASTDDGPGVDTAATTHNFGAVYLFAFADDNGAFSGGEFKTIIGHGYVDTPDYTGIDMSAHIRPVDNFGLASALSADGRVLAISAQNHDGKNNDAAPDANSGAVFLFRFDDGDFTNPQLTTIFGRDYGGTDFGVAGLDGNDNFGFTVALNGAGTRMAVGTSGDDGAGNAATNAGAVRLFSFSGASEGFTYADDAGDTVNIRASDLAWQLSQGTNLTLQANNDITVNTAIAVDNADGDGGDLTLQAGRSILLNAGITTDGGDLTLIANDDLASGVVNAHRDAGNAVITMGASSSINAGAGSVAIEMRTGAGKTNSGSGDITLRGITAGTLSVTSAAVAGDILLNGNITTSGAQDYTSERDVKLAASTTLSVSGAATLGIDAARQMLLGASSKIENTFDGNLTPFDAIVIEANRRAVAASGSLEGIQLNTGAIIRTAAGGAGAIDLSGRGGSSDGRGINMIGGSKIESLGSGTITLHGTGGAGTASSSYGVFLTISSEIIGTNGDIDIIGEAVGTGNVPGLYIFNGSQVRTTGTGNITLEGSTAGAGAGIWIYSGGASVKTAAGDIGITATSAAGGSPDFEIGSGGSLGVSGTNDITINADTVSFAGTVSGNGILTIQPRTDGRTIGLGDGAGDLALSAISLANIQNGFSEIVIGNADAGAITIGSGLSAFVDNLRFQSADALAIGGTLSVGSNRLTLDVADGGTQTAALTAGQLLLLSTDSDYTFDHSGNAVGTLAASVGAGSVRVNSGAAAALAVGTIGATSGIAADSVDLSTTDAAADILLNAGVSTPGAQTYTAGRDVKLAAGTTLAVSGAETLTLDAARQVSLGASAKIENTYSTDLTAFDAIVLTGNRRLVADAGNLSGIDLGAAAVVRTAAGGAGAIDISGRGGATLGHGIAMVTTATVESLGAGDITLTGEAVNSASNYSGVFIGGGSAISSVDGDIEVAALSTGSAGNYPALYVLGGTSATIQSSGTGGITLQGTRTTGDGEGIWIGLAGAKVQATSGNIDITAAAAVSTRDAVRLGGGGQIVTTAGGDITIEGTAATGGSGKDVGTLASSVLGGANTGDITINADTVAFAGSTTGAGTLTFQPRTGGRSIGIGTGAGDLGLSAATLGTVVNGFAEIVIGNAGAGAITVGTGLAAFNDDLRIVGGSTLSIGGALNVGSNRLTLDITGATGQSAAITAANLLLLNDTGTYTLTNTGNTISTLAADTDSIVLTHGGAGALAIGTVGTVSGITATSVALTATQATSSLIFNQDVTTSGAQTYSATLGNITANSGADLLVTGKAALALTAGSQISISGGTLENGYTGDTDSFDAIVLAANDDATPFSSAGSNAAITLKDGARITTVAGGGGAIRMTGKAGTGLSDAIGIRIADSTVESLGAGTVTLAGTGGAGATGGGRSGVVIGGTTGSRIESGLGDITITGIAGAATSGLANVGVDVAGNSTVVSTGSGPDAAGIIVSGTGGGSGGSTLNHGVRLAGALALSSDAGAITVTAAGGSPVSGSDNDGLVLSGAGAVIQSVSGEIVVDAAAGTGGKHLDNLAGSGAVASAGRWIIYLPDPDDTVFGDLASGSLPIWGQTGGTLPPASVGAGNRYVFALQPTLTASTAFSDDKVYGDAYSWPTPVFGTHYDLNGLVDASDYGNVWTQETLATIGLSGAPVLSSAGAAAGANVAGSPYGISLANGTLANTAGYRFGTPSSTGTLTVTPKTLTLTGVTAAGKDYDGDTDADLAGGALVGLVGSDDVEFSAGTGSFASKNVGTWAVTASGYALTGDDAGNYTLTQPTVADATITAKALTLTGVTATDKNYDGDTDADLSGGTLVGLVGSEDVGFSAGTGSFASKNIGTWTITASGYTLTGDDADNYTLTQPTVADATITAKALTLTGVTATDKDYDGDTDADLSGGTLVGLVGSEDVSFSAGTGSFASKNIGTWTITASGYALTGDDAGNYMLTQPSVADATITAKALTLTGVTASGKDYDGDADADLSGGVLVGVISGDDVEFTAGSGLFASKNAGTWSVTASGYTLGGDDAGNYTLTQPIVADATITAKALTLTGVTAAGKDYDGDTDADLSGGALVGIVGSDDVSFTAGTGAFASKNVGTWTVTASGYALTGDDAGNYTLAQPTVADATITAKTLTLTGVTAAGKDYDGDADADLSGGTLAGVIGSDDVGFSAGIGAFASKNAGTWAVTASGYALTGDDAGNYTLTQPTVADATITAKALTLTGVAAADKDYDGDDAADLSGGALVGIVGSDDVSFTGGTGAFASKNAGTWTVTATGYALTGDDAGNYTLAQPTVADASISAKALTLSGVSAADKTYDGDTDADLSGGTLAGIVGSDDVEFTAGSGAFASRNAGTWSVTASGYALTGDDAGNYTLTQPTVADATITAKALTLTGVTAAGKDYDGDVDAALSGGTLAGVGGGDDVGFTAGSGSFASRNVGTWSVTAAGYALTGDDAGNYTLAQPAIAAATITAKTLTLGGVAAADKAYDGTTGAALSGGALIGIVVGDDVGFAAGAGAFANRNAGTWSVTVTGYTLTGDDAGNYAIAQPVVADATITPRTLNAAVAALDKVYDGTRDAVLAFSTDDIVDGDTVAFDYEARFADRNAGTDKAVSLTGGVTLTGTDAANYTLAIDAGALSGLAADISARTLTVSTVAALDKVYDGTASAALAFTTADILSGDAVTFAYTAGFADRNAGTGKGVTASGVSLSGADGGNYALVLDDALLAGLTADIHRKALTLDGVAARDKTYDGTRNAALDFTTGGIVSGDDIGFLYEALTADGNAGSGKGVTVTDGAVALDGADAGNYDLGYDPALLAGLEIDIAARTLNVTAVTALDKVYDGTTSAALVFDTAGLVGGDTVAIDYSAAFADKNVGVGKSVSAEGMSLSGDDAANYVLALDSTLLAGLAADITARALTVSDIAALGKTYDGTRAAALAFTSDAVAGDNIAFGYEALFDDRNAGTGKAVTVTDGLVALTGDGCGQLCPRRRSGAARRSRRRHRQEKPRRHRCRRGRQDL